MPRGTWNLEWLNHNSQRAYPLADDATKVDTGGSFTLPDDFIVGLYIPIHGSATIEPSLFFISSVSLFATGYNISISYYNSGAADWPVVSVNIPKSTHVENMSYALAGIGDFDDTVGKIVIGSLTALDLLAEAQYLFDYDGGKLDTDTIRPMIRGVSSLVLINGPDTSERLYGDIELQAGTNIRLTPVGVGTDTPTIRIDAITGEGLTEDCVCDTEPTTGPGIRKINGISPTTAGDFTIIGDDCLTISGITNGIQLGDVCSKPCCGCTELTAIVSDLERFGDNARTLEAFITRLDAEVTQFSATVLGSRLGDRGCVEC
jgi:hypothetical protein